MFKSGKPSNNGFEQEILNRIRETRFVPSLQVKDTLLIQKDHDLYLKHLAEKNEIETIFVQAKNQFLSQETNLIS